MYAMTAAHPTLPLPSYARVTNVATGKSVVVRVNDRGPFLHGRVIDLSYAAAHKVGIAGRGQRRGRGRGDHPGRRADPGGGPGAAARGRGRARSAARPRRSLPSPAPISRDVGGGFVVQLGAFQNYNNAQTFLAHVQGLLASAQVEPRVRDVNGLYRVYVGPYADRDEAKRVADRLSGAFGFATAVAPH